MGGMKVYLYTFLTNPLDGGQWSASQNGRFIPWEREPGIRLIGGCVGPKASLDAVAKGKIPCPCRESKPSLYTN